MRKSFGIAVALAALVICTAWAPAHERERKICHAKDADICVLQPDLAQTQSSCPSGMLDCAYTDFCCPPQFLMYCAYDQHTGETNKCLAADTDEYLYYLQANCSYYLQCQ